MNKKIAMILGIVCLALTFAICVQIKTVESITEEEGIRINDNSELKDEVLRLRQIYNDAYAKLENAELQLEAIRTIATATNLEDTEIEEELKGNNKLLGLTEVQGSGIIIRLDDNREISSDDVIGDINSYLVHEGDLLQIVNELFNVEADAISINGKRIVSTTSILCDGNIIRINDEIVGVPIEIKAIGYPEVLWGALARPQGYLSLMADGGVIVSIEKSDNIVIPKYEGVYQYNYIKRWK